MNTTSHDPRYARYLQDDGFNDLRIRILQTHERLEADAIALDAPWRPLTSREVEARVNQHIEDLQQAQVDGFYEHMEALDYEADLEAPEDFHPHNDDDLT
jgi:hypothetical protein